MQDRLHEWLKKQRDELINMTRQNRLLHFKHTRAASMEIESPAPADVLARISPTGHWGFYLPPADTEPPNVRPPRAGELVIVGKDASQIERALRLLERSTTQAFVDKGLWVLYLGLGMLEWTESDADENAAESPLLLVPVTIARDSLREPFRLRRTDDDPVVNPALAVKLQTDFDIHLPTLDDFEENGLQRFIAQVHGLIRDHPRWAVRDRTVLCTFTFQKEAIHRDLLDNAETILASPLIQMLALGPDSPSAGDFDFEPVDEGRLDDIAPAEDLVSVLNADASQRQCVTAARAGRSFVMDGPPGSGKSQTITNIIAELMHAGKTVLFVSEKAAALDVVHKRLRKAKLDEFALQLHSHTATRKAVASELGKALSRRTSANTSFTELTRADLIRRRKALSAYAQAMNEVRQPLGQPLHQVLGRIAQLQTVPQAPVPSGFGPDLEPTDLMTIKEVAAELGRAWEPVMRGEQFLWRDLKDLTMSASRRSEVERLLHDALEVLAELRDRVAALDDDLGLGWYDGPSDGVRLLRLLEMLDERRPVPVNWLSHDDLDEISERHEVQSATTQQYRKTFGRLRELAGDGAADIDAHRSEPFHEAMRRLATASDAMGINPPWLPDRDDSAHALNQQRGFLDRSRALLDQAEEDARYIAAGFGLATDGMSLDRAIQLAELAELVSAPARPEAHWLNPLAQRALDEAAQVLGALVADFRAREGALQEVFTRDALTLDLAALQVRFSQVHKGLGKLRRAYRDDKRALAACTVTGRVDVHVLSRLAEGAEWKARADQLTEAESRHAAVLGEHYYLRTESDFQRIAAAIDVARQALRLAKGAAPGDAFVGQLARDGQSDPALPHAAQRLQATVVAWLEEARQLLGSATAQIQLVAIPQIQTWAAQASAELRTIASVLDHVSQVSGHTASIDLTTQVLDHAVEARRLRQRVEERFHEDARMFGSGFRGIETDWMAIGDAFDWTRRLRSLLGTRLPDQVAEAVLSTSATAAELRDQLARWVKAKASIVAEFNDRRAQTVAEALDDVFDDVAEIVRALAETVGDIEVWAAYSAAKSKLERLGLEPVVSFCMEQRVNDAVVPSVVERAVLEAWADSVIESDRDRLHNLRALERDALVDEFRKLDERQVASSAARVINACSARRPTAAVGEAAIIRRQGEIQRKHMPIRELLSRAGGAAQRLKPCFMMSPLSVSQYLPPTLRFDVVIFDEASQVLPSDAVNCVYRGQQLIVAGDQKQLPPTSFFVSSSGADDDVYDEDQIDEFESVLDLCKAAGGLRSLSLRWHYRSQHESLITFSNYRFYEGNLLTFPGATDEASDVGIKLFKVDGIYRRGGAKDNPVEAAKVVERVLYHRTHHPKLTLGVVTFSGSQEDAIERELERQARDHPELAGLHTDDRLDGFFIKNLENVQGDERDVIIFSIGYGPDEHGKFTMQIPHLVRARSERRLNVAITRAKRRVEIVTSVLAEDFPGTARAGAMRLLPGYLDFAERGIKALALEPRQSETETESPFEDEVVSTIRAWGFDAVPQVGVAGYRIDIGVRHPERPGLYALGVECDGAMYHSSKVARDRDRLRQLVLENLDWRIYRIWGPAWYRDRPREENRLRQAIDDAVHNRSSAQPERAVPVDELSILDNPADLDTTPAWTEPYRTANLRPLNTSIEMHVPEARSQLRRLIEEVVRQEGPVHEDLVLRTVRAAWGKGRSGVRITEAFKRAVRDLSRTTIERNGEGILSMPASTLRLVRVPVAGKPTTEREAKHVPQEELQMAIERIVKDAHSVTRDELTRHVGRLFGWTRRGPEVRAALERAVDELVDAGVLALDGQVLRPT